MSTSYTLRDLPLPVKVVASVFLMAVGVGYGSAMVQLHMQDSKSGQPMPTVDDVIKKFTGKVKYDPAKAPAAPVSTFVKLVSAPRTASFSGGGTMSPAFFEKDGGEWKKLCDADPATKPRLESQRAGEQVVAILWAESPPEARKRAYEEDKFAPADPAKSPKDVTPRFKNADGSFKVKSMIDARCARCHSKDGDPAQFPLETYDQIEGKYLAKPAAVTAQPGDWVKVEEPIGITKLTQSTHAHLLSFATLFSLTGLIFAFSSYPKVLRVVLGPWVVIAVFADVSLWWLARLSDQWGPYFAMGVVATGGAAGVGVALQIVLSLFNMYGAKGKVVLLVLFALGGGTGGLLWVNKIQPELDRKVQEAQCPVQPEPKPQPKADGGTVNAQNGNGQSGGTNDKKAADTPHVPINDLDRLLTLPVRDAEGKVVPPDKVQFNGGETGTMTKAFFDKDKSKAYQKVMDDPAVPQPEKDKLKAQRQAELDAVVAWVRSPDAPRKLAYETDAFDAPASVPKLTPQFVKDGKVRVKAIIGARCAACHSPGEKQEDYPLTNYEELSNYLKPIVPPNTSPPPADAQPAPAPIPAPTPAPAPAKAVSLRTPRREILFETIS
jgi:mono/diheme cytochrome c family protein